MFAHVMGQPNSLPGSTGGKRIFGPPCFLTTLGLKIGAIPDHGLAIACWLWPGLPGITSSLGRLAGPSMAHTSSSPSWLARSKVGVLGPSFPRAAPVRLCGTEWDEDRGVATVPLAWGRRVWASAWSRPNTSVQRLWSNSPLVASTCCGLRLQYLVPPPSVPGEDGAPSRGWPRSW